MEISFTKRGSKNHIISCKRKNGTVTWMHSSSFFITHDLCHYAVETKLSLKKSFYGMLPDGTDINDFELPKEQRPFQLTEEAIIAEHLVNLLAIEYTQGRIENFIQILKEGYLKENYAAEPTEIKQEKIDEIRNLFEKLMNQWVLLPEEDTMALNFTE